MDVLRPKGRSDCWADIANWRCLCWTACGSGKRLLPIFTAGTGFVLRALLRRSRGRSAALGRIAGERLRCEHCRATRPAHLHRILKRLDTGSGQENRLPPDEQKVIRAVEVCCADADKPVSEVLRAGRTPLVSLARIEGRIDADPREMLNERIRDRIDAMLERGWMRESAIAARSRPERGFEAIDFIGYRELRAVLRGETRLEGGAGSDSAGHAAVCPNASLTWFRQGGKAVRWFSWIWATMPGVQAGILEMASCGGSVAGQFSCRPAHRDSGGKTCFLRALILARLLVCPCSGMESSSTSKISVAPVADAACQRRRSP